MAVLRRNAGRPYFLQSLFSEGKHALAIYTQHAAHVESRRQAKLEDQRRELARLTAIAAEREAARLRELREEEAAKARYASRVRRAKRRVRAAEQAAAKLALIAMLKALPQESRKPKKTRSAKKKAAKKEVTENFLKENGF